MKNPICFISYSHEDDNHTAWVRNLASELRKNGVDVRLDQWDIRLGKDLLKFMETGVRDSDFVLLVCTPKFSKKSNVRQGGVGYEQLIVTAEIFLNQPEEKFVPILRKGNKNISIPSFLQSRVYIDFVDDEIFQDQLFTLLRHIHGKPKYVSPAIGSIPDFLNINEVGVVREKVVEVLPNIKLDESFLAIKDFALKYGPSLDETEILSWVIDNKINFKEIDIKIYLARYKLILAWLISNDGPELEFLEAKNWLWVNQFNLSDWSAEDINKFFIEISEFVSKNIRPLSSNKEFKKWVFDNFVWFAGKDITRFKERFDYWLGFSRIEEDYLDENKMRSFAFEKARSEYK